MMSSQAAPSANLPRLNALMDQQGLDALILRSGQNFTYLTGVVYPGTLARLQDLTDAARGVLLLWPRDGAPVILANKTAAGLARRDSRIDKIALYEGYVDSPYLAMAGLVRGRGLSQGRIGIEQDYVSLRDGAMLAESLPDATLVDCSDLMNRVPAGSRRRPRSSNCARRPTGSTTPIARSSDGSGPATPSARSMPT